MKRNKRLIKSDLVDDSDSSDDENEKIMRERHLESLKEELNQKLISFCAGKTGSVDENSIQDLLSQGADITATDEELGWTALMHSVKAGRLGLVGLLLEKGAEVNTADHSGFTALSVASYVGHQQITSLLLRHGADPRIESGSGDSPLFLAKLYSHTGVVEALTQHGVPPLGQGEREKLQRKLDETLVAAWEASNYDIDRDIMMAIADGADVNVTDGQGWSSLMVAANKGNYKATKECQPYAIKNQRKARNAPRAGSLWHKRAGVATL